MPAAINDTEPRVVKKEKTEKKASKRKADEVPQLVDITSDIKLKKTKVEKKPKTESAAAAISTAAPTASPPSTTPQEYRKLHDITVQSFGQGEPPLFQRFEDAPFPASLHAALKSAGFKDPSPIQAAAWPLALTGRDVLATAKTGSGEKNVTTFLSHFPLSPSPSPLSSSLI